MKTYAKDRRARALWDRRARTPLGVERRGVLGTAVVAGLLAASWLAGSTSPALAQDNPLLEKLDHGQVSWAERVVLATGSGAPNLKLPSVAAVRLNAERAAKVDAYRNIIETLKGLQITTEQLGSSRLENATVKTEVQGLLRGCKTIDTRYYSDGGVDVVLRCPLDDGLASVLVPSVERKDVRAEGAKQFTGLIIDATGLKFRPSLAPRIVDAAGREIYVGEMASMTSLLKQGATGFAPSLDVAKRDTRAGGTPLLLKASALGSKPGELVIDGEEAKKLEGQDLSFLKEARVVIVMDGLK